MNLIIILRHVNKAIQNGRVLPNFMMAVSCSGLNIEYPSNDAALLTAFERLWLELSNAPCQEPMSRAVNGIHNNEAIWLVYPIFGRAKLFLHSFSRRSPALCGGRGWPRETRSVHDVNHVISSHTSISVESFTSVLRHSKFQVEWCLQFYVEVVIGAIWYVLLVYRVYTQYEPPLPVRTCLSCREAAFLSVWDL